MGLGVATLTHAEIPSTVDPRNPLSLNALQPHRCAPVARRVALRLTLVGVVVLASGCNRGRSSQATPNESVDASVDAHADVFAADSQDGFDDLRADPFDPEADTDPDACASVCFDWLDTDPVALPEPGATRPPVEVRSEVCNPNGIAPGQCPSGTACVGSEQRWVSPTVYVDRVTCDTELEPLALTLDAPDVDPEDGLDVVLAFTWNGEPWPYQGLEGGELTVVDADGVRVARITSWERTPDAVPLRVPPGEYRVSFSPPSAGDSVAPILTRAGRLRIATAGAAVVDVEGVRVAPEVLLDGAPLERPDDWAALLLQLRTAEGFLRTVRLEPTDPIPPVWRVQRRPLTLEAVALARTDAPSAIAGWIGTSGVVEPETGDLQRLRVNARRAAYLGTVLVDGAPPDGDSVVQVIDAANQLREAPVDATTGNWRLDAFEGEAVAAWVRPANPNQRAALAARTGAVPLRTDEPLAIERTTTTVSGVLLVAGEPEGAPLANLRLVYESGDVAELAIGDRGAIAGRAFAGVSDAWVLGDGFRVPAGAQQVRDAARVSAEFETFEVDAVDVNLAVDNQTPVAFVPENGAGVLTLSMLTESGRPVVLPSIVNDQARPVATAWAMPAEGPPLRARLSPGPWSALWQPPIARGTDPVALAPFVLEPFDVGPDTTEVVARLELRTLPWVLIANGVALPTDTEGSAGELQFGDVFVPIPAGFAEGAVALFPGTYEVTYACRATQGCRGIAEAPNRRLLVEGLRVP